MKVLEYRDMGGPPEDAIVSMPHGVVAPVQVFLADAGIHLAHRPPGPVYKAVPSHQVLDKPIKATRREMFVQLAVMALTLALLASTWLWSAADLDFTRGLLTALASHNAARAFWGWRDLRDLAKRREHWKKEGC